MTERQVVTQLVVDASGAKTGVDEFESALERARAAVANTDGGVRSFDSTLKQWTKSLSATDPVLRAQVQQQQAVQRQTELNTRAIQLGIATQDAANAQLERVRQNYQGYIDRAERAAFASTGFGQAISAIGSGIETASAAITRVTSLVGTLGVALSAAAVVQFGRSVFDTTADLQEQADQILGSGGNVEALQAIHAAFLTNGISVDQGDKLLQKLTQTLGDAAQGSDKAQDAFKALHLGASQLAGKTADSVLPLIATRLLDVSDAATRASIEAQLFGRTGQQLESALSTLATPMDQLIQHAKDIGVVIDADMIQKADDAKDQMALSFMKLETAVAPVVTEWAAKFTSFADSINGSTDAVQGLIDKIGTLVGVYVGARIGGAFGPWGAVAGGVAGYAIANPTKTANLVGNIGLSEAGYDTTVNANPIDYAPGVPFRGLIEDSRYKTAYSGIGGGQIEADSSTAAWKLSQKDIDAYNKIKETFSGYLAELKEASSVAGETAAQRETELAVIKGAQIAEREHGIAARDVSKTYADSLGYLGLQRVEQIAIEESTKRVQQMRADSILQQALISAGAATDADHRALVLKNLQDEIAAGGIINQNGQLEIHLTDQARQAIEEKNAAEQAGRDNTAMRDYLSGLREEVSLAGLASDERDRQRAILQATHMMHGNITQDQLDEINGLINIRQETERWRSVVDSLASPNEEYPDGFVIQVKDEVCSKLQEIFA